MKHKYFIIKDNEKNELIIREFAELEKSDFSLLYEVAFGNEKIESAISKGKNALISAIRTQNMYPPIIYAEKITESIVQLYDSKNDQSIELFFDDKDFLAKNLKAFKTSGVKKDACLSGCLPRQRNVDRVTLATLQDVPTPPRTAPHRWAQPRARRSPARCQMRPLAKTYG